jgi:predicted HAD superfamily hydrolase
MSTSQPLSQQLLAPDVRAVSVDIFDTVLLRNTKPEHLRFRQIASRWAEHLRAAGKACSPDDLYFARLRAAHVAYRTAEMVQWNREAKFDHILNLTCHAARIDPSHAPTLRRIEVDYEKDNLAPNRPLVDLLRTARTRGKKVVYISDMYLSGADVAELIAHHIPDSPFDAGFLSSDIGLTKRGGLLFDHVCAALNLPPAEVFHLGDSRHADVEMPVKHGLRALHTPRPASWQRVRSFRERLTPKPRV